MHETTTFGIIPYTLKGYMGFVGQLALVASWGKSATRGNTRRRSRIGRYFIPPHARAVRQPFPPV